MLQRRASHSKLWTAHTCPMFCRGCHVFLSLLYFTQEWLTLRREQNSVRRDMNWLVMMESVEDASAKPPEEDSNDQKSSKRPGKLPDVAHWMPLIRLILTQLDRLDSPDLTACQSRKEISPRFEKRISERLCRVNLLNFKPILRYTNSFLYCLSCGWFPPPQNQHGT